MRKRVHRTLGFAVTLGSTLMAAAPAVNAQGIKGHLFGAKHERMHEEFRTVEDLAALIDRLDKELFKHGKIAVKSPDVWGQNRMTKFRTEYEDQMKEEVRHFKLMLQSYQRRADVAALTSATTIAAAVQPTTGRGSRRRNDGTSQSINTTVSVPTNAVSNASDASEDAEDAAEETPTNSAVVAMPGTPGIPGGLVKNANELLGNPTAILGSTNALANLILANNSTDGEGFGLEPTIALDQKARYLDHLATLRRNNLGDDTTDLPGYGLYLLRMPISLLPGAESQRGKGASVTLEAKFDPTPDLLPVTFRSVVILDASYQLKDILMRALHGSIDLTQPNPAKNRSTEDRPFSNQERTIIPPNSTSPAHAAISPVELLDVIGRGNLEVLTKELENDEKDWFHHDPSILSWLLSQYGNAYNFYRDGARRGDPLFDAAQVDRLGELAFQRRYAELKTARAEFLSDLIIRRTGKALVPEKDGEVLHIDDIENSTVFRSRINVIDILTYSLMIQMYYLDRQIKFDMEVVARRTGSACGDPWPLAMFEADPSEEARATFGAYVAAKWPIHVFSLDPAVDQQNQLDLFSRRSELQLALAAAVASGQVNFQNATTYARRLETDLATIDLNRTAIGFGAGDTTFGWRFQPRVQTPPEQNNLRRAVGLVWRGGPSVAYDVANRRIEPGPRECVACVVAPNFVPQFRLTSVANWYDLQGHHMDQTMDTKDMVRMGAKLQAARDALQRICDDRSYPPDQLQMLSDRLDQLQAMLPMKAHRVNLPFEGDLTASEIFSSSNAGLAPKLLTWYGEPQKNGESSSLFILGTGFSIHELQVIAGGVLVEDRELLSRNVLRIAIPKDARLIQTNVNASGKRRNVIDVHVATPNGVSNHLLIEAEPAAAATPAASAPRKSAYAVNDRTRTLAITYNLTKAPFGRFTAENGQPDEDAALHINWSAPTGVAPKKIHVKLIGEYKGGRLEIPLQYPLTLTASGSVYKMELKHLEEIAAAYVKQLEGYSYFTPEDPLPALKMTSIQITPIGGYSDVVTQVLADNDLTIQPKLIPKSSHPTKEQQERGVAPEQEADETDPEPRLEDAAPTELEAIESSTRARSKIVIPPPNTVAARRDASVQPTAGRAATPATLEKNAFPLRIKR